MKIQKILLAAITVMLLMTSSAWAHNEGEKSSHTNGHGHWFRYFHGHWFKHEHRHWFNHDHDHGHGHGLIKVPEIDATSGTSAIVLVTGVLLLAGERTRSQRS